MEDNVVALVDAVQVFRNTYEYSAYGTTVTTGGLAPVANSYLYKTTPMDPESGMYSAFRRMYNPAFNRYTGTGPYDQLDYGTPAFALGRPHILRPEDGIAHGYTTLLDEPMPLPNGFQLPGLALMQPGILSAPLVQWGYGVMICHRTGQELSCAGLDGFPSTPAELAGKVNGFAELALRLERPQPSVLKREYPVRPDSVDRGSDE
jgi:hypothetical protein